jgi:NTP pyrophosphatase (non-canonical NTP hydrolase)
MNIRELQYNVHQLAVSKGWYENVPSATDPTWIGARLALIHSEVSEALEDVRDGNTLTTIGTTGKPCGLPSELADIIIRVLDLAGSLNIDMQAAIEMKHAYNVTRPHRHGGRSL